jgi:rhodanese-related sulfurtransferase
VSNIPASEIVDRISELPRDRPIVVHCQGGTRSAIAAGLLDARGLAQVHDMPGGFTEWEAAGLPVERGEGSLAELTLASLERATQRSG